MSLTSAFQTSSSALTTLSGQTALVSRNIAGAGNAAYGRKIVQLSTGLDGAAHITGITRAVDGALSGAARLSTSLAARDQAIADGLNALGSTLGAKDYSASPAAALGALNDALQQYAVSPSDRTVAATVLQKADALAGALNDGTAAVQSTRAKADSDIKSSVDTINRLLTQFQQVDTAIVRAGGADSTDDQDTRDSLLSQLASEIGITTTTRADGSTAIYTDSGVALYDRVPRNVTFQPTTAFTAGTAGNAVYVDGVDVTTGGGTQALSSGRIAGLATLRDQTTVAYQAQLDETARGLISAFAEKDQSVPATLPDAPGLFTWSGDPALPGAGLTTELAASIKVNPTVDPAAGGDITRIRDGGAAAGGNPAYRDAAATGASYSAHLNALIGSLAASRGFDPAAGLAGQATLADFSTQSIGWVEQNRQSASVAASSQAALRDKASAALSSETGVNLDDELSKLLDLEHAYAASAKLISAVDQLYGTLFQAIQ